MDLPKFSELNTDYNPAQAKERLQAVVAELSKGVPDKMSMVGLGTGDLSARWKALVEDVQKRADHKGIHGFKHDLKLHGGGFAEEVVLFVIEQAVLLAQLDAGVKDKLDYLAGGDAANPGNLVQQGENAASKGATGLSGDAARAGVEKLILSPSGPKPPEGQPSAHDLLYYSTLTYQYLDKALWHTLRARKARRILDAYKKKNGGKVPMRHCSDAAVAAFLLQTYFHHFHKASVYASPMFALVEFVTHYTEQWRKQWVGSGETDAAALNNLAIVYDTIFALRATHKQWDCVAKGGLCYGPGDDPKKQATPLKALGATDGTDALKPPLVSQPWYEDVKKKAIETADKASKAWAAAGVSVDKFFGGTKFKANVFYEETLKPLFDEENFLEGEDVRAKEATIRDTEKVEEVLRDVKLQAERFNFWVMAQAGPYDLKADKQFVQRSMRRVVAGVHDDEKHEAQPPFEKIFKDKKVEALYARLMYDVYGLVEAKDLGKNVKNAWKKFWAPQKKGELAVTLLFLAGGIAVSIGTAGIGLPVVALLGIAAGKKIVKKATLKGVKAANSKLNSKTLKGGDTDENTELTLNASEAREGAASLARHFVSAFKNLNRLQGLKEQYKANKDAKAYFPNCAAAASYAYAAYAFDHHFTKVLARLQNLTAMAQAALGTLSEGDAYFASAEFTGLVDEIHKLVAQPASWHTEHCDGKKLGAKSRLTASRASPVYVSQNLPSAICYAPNENAPVHDTSGSAYAVSSPQRGLFWGDYINKKNAAYPPFDMLEHWVNARDLVLKDLKDTIKADAEAEAKKDAELIKDKADQAPVMERLGVNAAAEVPGP